MIGHKSATIDCISKQPVVLMLQDTTFLNFATESESKDMGTLRAQGGLQSIVIANLGCNNPSASVQI